MYNIGTQHTRLSVIKTRIYVCFRHSLFLRLTIICFIMYIPCRKLTKYLFPYVLLELLLWIVTAYVNIERPLTCPCVLPRERPALAFRTVRSQWAACLACGVKGESDDLDIYNVPLDRRTELGLEPGLGLGPIVIPLWPSALALQTSCFVRVVAGMRLKLCLVRYLAAKWQTPLPSCCLPIEVAGVLSDRLKWIIISDSSQREAYIVGLHPSGVAWPGDGPSFL